MRVGPDLVRVQHEPSLSQSVDAVVESSPNMRTGNQMRILILWFFLFKTFLCALSEITGTEEEDGDSMNG